MLRVTRQAYAEAGSLTCCERVLCLAGHCFRSRECSCSAGAQGPVAGTSSSMWKGCPKCVTGFKMRKCQEGTEAVIRSCWGYREGGGWGRPERLEMWWALDGDN